MNQILKTSNAAVNCNRAMEIGYHSKNGTSLKKQILKLIIFVLFCSFIGCSKNDDIGHVGTREDLIGTWSQIHAKGYVIMDGNKINYDTNFDEGIIKWTFYQNGTGSASIHHPYLSGFGTFTWTFENGNITIIGYYDSMSGKVLKLTSSSLVFEVDLDQEKQNEKEQHEKFTCVRY